MLFAQQIVQLEKKIYFEKNSHKLSKRATSYLDSLAPLLKKQKNLKNSSFFITGHSDTSEMKNIEVSRERACEVKKYLVDKHRIKKSRLMCKGAGYNFPVADNTFETGRKLNRRVVISKQIKKATTKGETTVHYQYDKLGRLIEASYSNGLTTTIKHDAMGNIIYRNDDF